MCTRPWYMLPWFFLYSLYLDISSNKCIYNAVTKCTTMKQKILFINPDPLDQSVLSNFNQVFDFDVISSLHQIPLLLQKRESLEYYDFIFLDPDTDLQELPCFGEGPLVSIETSNLYYQRHMRNLSTKIVLWSDHVNDYAGSEWGPNVVKIIEKKLTRTHVEDIISIH